MSSQLLRFVYSILLGAMWLPFSASAAPMEIIASPQNTQSPFRHNVFHTAESDGGIFGSVLAWFDLDTDASNTYDPDSGFIQFSFNIFSDSALSTQIGTGTAIGNNLLGTTLGDGFETDVIVGFVTWDVIVDVPSNFLSHLQEHAFPSEVVPNRFAFISGFADILYMTSPQGRTPNSWDGEYLSLWGTDGNYVGVEKFEGSGGLGGFENSWTGVDLVLQVPEPRVSLLAVAGLAGLWFCNRRFRR